MTTATAFATVIRVRLHQRYRNAFTVGTIRPSSVTYWPPVVLRESGLIHDAAELECSPVR